MGKVLVADSIAKEAIEKLQGAGHEVDVKTGLSEDELVNAIPPYDAIIVTAAPDHIPQPLVQQLAVGGRLVIPVGPPGGYQTLWKITKRGDEVITENMGGVIFVPLLRGER